MDAIDYVQRRNGLSFREAVAHLNNGGLPVSIIVHAPLAGRTPPAPVRKRPAWRSAAWQGDAWQGGAWSLVRRAHCRLNGAEGKVGQSYLLGRSILPATWQAWGLGYFMKAWHPLRRQHLPAITLPWQQDQRLCAVQYRFIDSGLDTVGWWMMWLVMFPLILVLFDGVVGGYSTEERMVSLIGFLVWDLFIMGVLATMTEEISREAKQGTLETVLLAPVSPTMLFSTRITATTFVRTLETLALGLILVLVLRLPIVLTPPALALLVITGGLIPLNNLGPARTILKWLLPTTWGTDALVKP